MPTEQVERTVAAVIEEARAWTRGLVELPAGEGVVLEIVRDEPWLAFCDYLGDLRSRIAVNVDLPMSALELLRLTIHETYPGHHAERSSKEHLLVRGRGLLEETLVLVPTPQSLVSEGIAERAPNVLLEGDGGAALAAVMHDAGFELDLAHALAVERALEPCTWAEVNAALMLHDAGASEAEAQAYLERWGLMTPKLAAHLIRFLTEPTSRTYMITYPAGRELCRSYVAGEPERFRRLLTEQVRVRDLLEARDARRAAALGVAACGPGDCLERERRVGRELPAALFQLLEPNGVQPGRIFARGTDPERERLPPIVKTRVLHSDGQFGVVDIVEAGGLEQLGEVARAGARAPRFVLSVRIELPNRRPEQAECTPPAGVIPDGSGDDATGTGDSRHLAQAAGRDPP